MFVRNEATGRLLRIVGHALDQWRARVGGTLEEMADAIRQAIPYGGQLQRARADRKSDELLMAGDVCFVIGADAETNTVVRTVLTMAQAKANMETYQTPELVPSELAMRRRRVRVKRRQNSHDDERRNLSASALARIAATRRRPRQRYDARLQMAE